MRYNFDETKLILDIRFNTDERIIKIYSNKIYVS